MENGAHYRGPCIFPELRYDDARAGIAFLERAFGFEAHLVVPGEGDAIAHAEVRVGRGFIMLGTSAADRWSYRTPRALGGINTGGIYTALLEVDALYARAKSAGARIVRELEDTDYGSRNFSAYDPEGFLWHFGTYHPTIDGCDPQGEREIYAGMWYGNARKAISWLIEAFGFQEHFVVPGVGDDIVLAQMRFGSSVLMLGSTRDDEFNTKSPLDLDGAYTQTLNVYVADPDAHCSRAKAAGAAIVDPPADTPYGARGYVARDPEGYVWNFSTYHPVQSPSVDAVSTR